MELGVDVDQSRHGLLARPHQWAVKSSSTTSLRVSRRKAPKRLLRLQVGTIEPTIPIWLKTLRAFLSIFGGMTRRFQIFFDTSDGLIVLPRLPRAWASCKRERSRDPCRLFRGIFCIKRQLFFRRLARRIFQVKRCDFVRLSARDVAFCRHGVLCHFIRIRQLDFFATARTTSGPRPVPVSPRSGRSVSQGQGQFEMVDAGHRLAELSTSATLAVFRFLILRTSRMSFGRRAAVAACPARAWTRRRRATKHAAGFCLGETSI